MSHFTFVSLICRERIALPSFLPTSFLLCRLWTSYLLLDRSCPPTHHPDDARSRIPVIQKGGSTSSTSRTPYGPTTGVPVRHGPGERGLLKKNIHGPSSGLRRRNSVSTEKEDRPKRRSFTRKRTGDIG